MCKGFGPKKHYEISEIYRISNLKPFRVSGFRKRGLNQTRNSFKFQNEGLNQIRNPFEFQREEIKPNLKPFRVSDGDLNQI